MTSRTFTSNVNLEAHVAALLVQTANKYICRLIIRTGTMESNCKSIMGIVSMSIFEGQEVTISADGPGEAEALSAICKMLAEAR